MTAIYRANVLETSDTQGTGALTLAGAATGARSFRAAFGDGPVTVGYIIRSAVEDGEFETGIGTFEFAGGEATLSRDTVLESSNSNAAVNWGPGTRTVWCAPDGLSVSGVVTGNRGPVRPAWLQPGGTWVDDNDANAWAYYFYDGAQDILMGTFDPVNHTFTAEVPGLTGVITPGQITSDQNNYAPTGHESATLLRLSTDATRTVTGLAGGIGGALKIIANVGSNALVLAHESASSTAANRFRVGGRPLVLRPGASVLLLYDSTGSRWQVVEDRAAYGTEATVPVGAVMQFAGPTAPDGWLLCYGQAISRTDYAALFEAIGTTYGDGDGSTTFNLPDCRGRGVIGKDDMGGSAANRVTTGGSGLDGATVGASGGAETVTLDINQMPAHAHGVSRATNNRAGGGDNISTIAGTYTTTYQTSETVGGGQGHNNMPPSIVMNTIIFSGVYS